MTSCNVRGSVVVLETLRINFQRYRSAQLKLLGLLFWLSILHVSNDQRHKIPLS